MLLLQACRVSCKCWHARQQEETHSVASPQGASDLTRLRNSVLQQTAICSEQALQALQSKLMHGPACQSSTLRCPSAACS